MEDGGQRTDGAPATGLPIVLVCSTGDLGLADEAATGLRARGHEVAVLGGAEEGTQRLTEVVSRFQRQGLYVLCRGGELDRDGVDRLRALLRAQEVPFGRTLTLPTAQGGARALEERVVSVARRMVTGRFSRSQASIDGEEEELEPTPDGAPEAVVQRELSGVDPHDVDRWADSLAGGVVPHAAPRPATLSGAHAAVEVEAGDGYTPLDRTLVTRHPIPAAVEREESSAPTASTPSDSEDDDDVSASAFSSGPDRRLIIAAGVALVLIIVLAIAFSGSDDSELSTTDVVALSDEAEPDRAAEPDEPEPAKAQPPAAEPDEVEVEVEVEPAAVSPAEENPPPDEPGAMPPLDLEGAQKVLAHRSAVDPALTVDAPLPPSAPQDRAAIAQALEEREIRSWNAFLIAGDDAPEMTFGDAETYCKTLSAGDISGWRLASIGELFSLAEAKLLDSKSVLWSETPGDAFGDTRIVFNVRKGSTAPVGVEWDGGRPICVRVRE